MYNTKLYLYEIYILQLKGISFNYFWNTEQLHVRDIFKLLSADY